MGNIMATRRDMTGNLMPAWCSLQDQNSTDWREQCRFFLCTFIQLVSSIAESHSIEELSKAMNGQNVKDRVFTVDLQTIFELHKVPEPVLPMTLEMFSIFIFVLLPVGHKNDCAVFKIRPRWWYWLSHVAVVSMACFNLFVRNSTWLFPDGYEPISLLLGFDSRDLITPAYYVVHWLVIAICLEIDRRCSCSSPCRMTAINPESTTLYFIECISILRELCAQTVTVFHRKIVSLTSFTHHPTTRHWRGVEHEFNPSFVTSRAVFANCQRNFQRIYTEENSVCLNGDAASLRSSLLLTYQQPNCSHCNENEDDVSAEIPSFSSRSSSQDTGSRRDDTCDHANALSCFASKAKKASVSTEVSPNSSRSSSPDAGSRRRDSGDDSDEDALSCFATSKPNCSDEKDADVSPNSSRSSSPDTDSQRGYTGDVSFAQKVNSSDGDEADVSADTTPRSSRSSSPDKGTSARGRCADDDIDADASAASWISSPPSTYDHEDKREVPAQEDYALQSSSSVDSDLQQEDVSGSLQETVSLCSSWTFFRPIRHDGRQGRGPCTTDTSPSPSSPTDGLQICEETDENVCSSVGRDTDFCSPLNPCVEENSRTEDKPHCVVSDSSGDSRRSSASVVPNCGSDYASDSGSSGESIFTVTKYSMGIKSYLLPSTCVSFDSRSGLSASVEAKCGSDCTSFSSDDSIFKGNECSIDIEKGIDKLLKRRALSERQLIGKRPSGLESVLNFEFSKRRKLNESDSGDSIL